MLRVLMDLGAEPADPGVELHRRTQQDHVLLEPAELEGLREQRQCGRRG